ncbi:hypothetical protein MARI_27250 [Marinobacter sp. JH2]|nr:DUF6746 family protein [Marinobacter sp. JH2]QBM18584.1 hypothetical protein MARI_27250 [Marinobacter sp. JH2]
MALTLKLATAAATLLFTFPAFAGEDYNHFKGEPAETLTQAVVNLSDYNNKLEQVLSGDLTPESLHEVHQLTYTLENALSKLDDELEDIAERLEKVHKASEHADPDTVKKEGQIYLTKTRTIIK